VGTPTLQIQIDENTMDEKSKKQIPVKTQKEILEDIRNKLESHQKNAGDPPSFLEGLFLIANEYSIAKTANESRKSPEQRAQEAKQAQLSAKEFALEKAKKEQTKRDILLRSWIKRDTWLIYDEALPLTKAVKPDYETLFSPRDSDLWELVQSCAGHSLTLVNKEANPKQWLVEPFEWVRWLKEKGQHVHPQLVELLYPRTEIQPALKTAKAIQSREIKKRDRQKAIRTFALEAETRARKNNIVWNKEEIPVTKSDFLKVFGILNPAYKKINMATFDRDIADIGLKFKRGTKSNKNNVLKSIFSIS